MAAINLKFIVILFCIGKSVEQNRTAKFGILLLEQFANYAMLTDPLGRLLYPIRLTQRYEDTKVNLFVHVRGIVAAICPHICFIAYRIEIRLRL